MKQYFIFIFFLPIFVQAQFAPAAGKDGSTAIYMDSSIFVHWATVCQIERGLMDAASPELGYASFGDESMATGKAEGMAVSVLSLGDFGQAILSFEYPITNGSGFDFAVFENSFSDDFLELAFVEVSSDGDYFVRFPAVSYTQTDVQVEPFGIIDPEKIHNLAGKYRQGFGTPFDLEDLKDIDGLDVNHIIRIRILDVCGSIQTENASFDSQGNIINDPYPTAFESGGFDLDAVGVIHQDDGNSIQESEYKYKVYPLLVEDMLYIDCTPSDLTKLQIYGITGKQFVNQEYAPSINISQFKAGIYVLLMQWKDGRSTSIKFIKN